MSQHQERLNVISWATPFVAFALLAFLFTSSIGQSQSQTRSSRTRASQQLICTISSFYSIDANEQVSENLRIEGRGLATCKNDQGFRTDVPVSSVITARAIGNWANAGELSFSGNSASFVIPRDLAQVQDTYEVKPYASNLAGKSVATALFGGQDHNLLIEMRFTSATQTFEKIDLTSMTLHFDESAPTLD